MAIIFKLVLLGFLILCNGFFVASEYVLISLRKTHVEDIARSGNRSAILFVKALNHLPQYISATQLGVTIASVAIGWIGEPLISLLITPLFVDLVSPSAFITVNTIATIIAFALVTFLTVVFGELAPKITALQRTEKLGFLLIRPLIVFTYILMPAIWLLNISGSAVVKLIGLTPQNIQRQVYSEQEISVIANSSAASGAIQKEEAELVAKALQLDDISVREIMLPRGKIRAIQEGMTLGKVVSQVIHDIHTRFPVYKRSIDEIIGFIHMKDIYKLLLENTESLPLSQTNAVRRMLFVPETMIANDVLLLMKKNQIHIAIVQSKQGRTLGLVTLEDIFESLVGEIEDEF